MTVSSTAWLARRAGALLVLAASVCVGDVAAQTGSTAIPTSLNRTRARFVMDRLTFGATITGIDTVRGPIQNYYNWLDSQLQPDLSGNPGSDDAFLLGLVAQVTPSAQGDPARWDMVENARLARATTTEWQLNEVMTQFWEQHFNTFGQSVENYLKGVVGYSSMDAENVAIWLEWSMHEYYRQNALGQFEDMLLQTTLSPAMMIYLNMVNSSTCANPNENYARELLELYSMGPIFINPNGADTANYSPQADVLETAKCFTGWRLQYNTNNAADPIQLLPPTAGSLQGHCVGTKVVFSGLPHETQPINNMAQPARELTELVQHIARCEPTKDFICRKLLKVFLGETANGTPADLVAGNLPLLTAMKAAWGTRGDIKAVVGVLFRSGEFLSARYRLRRAKMPLEAVASWLRIWDADVTTTSSLLASRVIRPRETMNRIGQTLFMFPAPDGFPIESVELPGSSVALETMKTLGDLYRQDGDDFYPTIAIKPMIAAELTTLADRNDPNKVAEVLLDRLYGNRWTATDLGVVANALSRNLAGTQVGLDFNAPNYESRIRIGAMVAGTNKIFFLK